MYDDEGLSGGPIAGIVIGVVAIVAICVGCRQHQINKKKAAASLLRSHSEHGFEEVRKYSCVSALRHIRDDGGLS